MLMLQRIDYLDIAKGFGIIFVILGHCMLGHNSSLHSVLYSFHMPLFSLFLVYVFQANTLLSLW